MKIRIFLFILLIFTSSCKKKNDYKCDKMDISLKFNHTDYYDSHSGLFVRKYWEKTESIKILLSQKEKKEINKIIEVNNFLEIPSVLEYNSYEIIPAQYAELNYSNSCISKKTKASYNDRIFFNNNKITNFKNIINSIANIIYSNEQVKKLPASNILIE